MKKVKIELITSNITEDSTDNSRFVYEGEMESINGADYLKYSELTEGTRINTIIKAKEKTVVITRKGGFGSVLKIEEGKTNQTEYQTPYGAFPLAVVGKRCENNLKNGKLIAEYVLLSNNEIIGKNKIDITVKEV